VTLVPLRRAGTCNVTRQLLLDNLCAFIADNATARGKTGRPFKQALQCYVTKKHPRRGSTVRPVTEEANSPDLSIGLGAKSLDQ
jgi:hypothetical protein